ncbi:MAG: efflux RND transporter periplasmic adaptor subunit [Gemmatimonadaceae bacterium]
MRLPSSLTVAALLAATAFAGCRKDADDAAEQTAAPVVGVRTTIAQAQPFTETVGAIGDVEARRGHSAALGAPGAARISRVLVSAGQHVAAGDVLVELDQTAFQAAAASADAQLAASQGAYDRAKRLADAGIVPRKDVEQAAAELAKARADAAMARRAAQLSVLRAPISGVVTSVTATLGATADPAQPLVQIADPSATDVVLNTTPADAARIHDGATVSIVAGQSAGGESLGSGTVADVGGTVDSATRSVPVRVRIISTRRPLRIGETVFGEIATAARPNAIVVPVDALVPEGDGFKVFVVDANSIAHARPVTIGGRTSALAEITDGVKAGEKVVTYGAYGVEDSAKVVPAAGDGTTP